MPPTPNCSEKPPTALTVKAAAHASCCALAPANFSAGFAPRAPRLSGQTQLRARAPRPRGKSHSSAGAQCSRPSLLLTAAPQSPAALRARPSTELTYWHVHRHVTRPLWSASCLSVLPSSLGFPRFDGSCGSMLIGPCLQNVAHAHISPSVASGLVACANLSRAEAASLAEPVRSSASCTSDASRARS
eukprot:7382809-Prymnesium_polylepis.1